MDKYFYEVTGDRDKIINAFNEISKSLNELINKGFERVALLDVESLIREEKKARKRRRYYRMMKRIKNGKQ